MATYKKLNAKRAAQKGQMRQFQSFVDNCEDQRITQLPERLEKAAELWQKFDEVQTSIEELRYEELSDSEQDRAELEQEFAVERNCFNDMYFATVAKAKAMMTPVQDVHTQQQGYNREVNAQANKINVKLPTLDLPRFDGSYNKWLSFKDTFTSVIDSNNKLTNIQKFQYLRSALIGDSL